VSDGLFPDLTIQIVTGQPTREDVPLLTLLENELANGTVSLSSHRASSSVKVELGTELGSGETRHANHQLDCI